MQNLRTNITTVRLIDPTSRLVQDVVQDLNFVRQRMNMDSAPLRADQLTVSAMLMHDAVNVYARTVKGLGTSGKITAERLQCASAPFTPWSGGFKLMNFMRVVSIYYCNNMSAVSGGEGKRGGALAPSTLGFSKTGGKKKTKKSGIMITFRRDKSRIRVLFLST